MPFTEKLKSVLAPAEHKLFTRLSTPQKIQDYLDTLPINFELSGETYMSPRRVLQSNTAHCFEGALFAAAVLAYHGHKPLIMDIRTTADDEDHVVTIFQEYDHWGAISKTNHSILRYRDSMYRNPRELVMSYFHEYMLNDGLKTMREYSKPFDLSRFHPEKWVTAQEDLFWLVDALDESPHEPVAPRALLKRLRPGSNVEVKAMLVTEWSKRGKVFNHKVD